MGTISLTSPYASRYGVPVIHAVDPDMFRYRYFTRCMHCDFCHDQCCEHGVDVDFWHVRAMDEHRQALEAFTGVARSQWFDNDIEDDPELPGGGSRHTQVNDGTCVFLNRRNRGCLVHEFCRDKQIDFRQLKSIVDCLFPITFGAGVLTVADEVSDGTLVCLDTGPTVYQGLRSELLYYFGVEFVAELDERESTELRGVKQLGTAK